MKITKKEKEELCNKFDIAISTFYKWEKTKPELIKYILLGLEKEKELNNEPNEFQKLDKKVGNLVGIIERLENKINILESKASV